MGAVWTAAAAAALAGAAVICAAATPPPDDPAVQAAAGTALFAVPEIDVDPHSGVTLGLIPVALRTNSRGDIDRIIAPDVIHSQYFGWGSRMRVFGYPSTDRQWSIVGGAKQRVEREFDARFIDGQTRRDAWSWSVEAIYDRSGVPRFFGIGNESSRHNETTYVADQSRLDLAVGYNFSPVLQLAWQLRVHYFDVLPGVLKGLPGIAALFPQLPGLGMKHVLQPGLALTVDTRDSPVIPHSGARYIAYGGVVSRALGSSASYSYLGMELRQYWPLSETLTLAWHAAVRYMPEASDAPFWALSSLGGDRSVTGEREPLRAYGEDRYIDRNLYAAGAELRAVAGNFRLMGTHVSLEVAPFVDAGKVFGTSGGNPLTKLHHSVGLGIRAVASPSVVGYVDFGFSGGRSAVFSGIDYPF
ncbi:MAG: BamA/TamA family outer membrane protein [Proteobacteria bacterium]|nr:BamA/TamA family outer membrane protein [Pseudomonadota bacterium]